VNLAQREKGTRVRFTPGFVICSCNPVLAPKLLHWLTPPPQTARLRAIRISPAVALLEACLVHRQLTSRVSGFSCGPQAMVYMHPSTRLHLKHEISHRSRLQPAFRPRAISLTERGFVYLLSIQAVGGDWDTAAPPIAVLEHTRLSRRASTLFHTHHG
jgi:hypothetical protein